MQRAKSVKKSITLPAHQEEWLTKLRDSRPGADFSSVLQSIVEEAMQQPDPLSRAVLVDLVERLHPNWLPKLHSALARAEERTQPELLMEALWLAIEYINAGGVFRGDYDPMVVSSTLPRTAIALSRCRQHHFDRSAGTGAEGTPHDQRSVLADLLCSVVNVIDLDGTGRGENLASVIFQASELLAEAKRVGNEYLGMAAETGDSPAPVTPPKPPAGPRPLLQGVAPKPSRGPQPRQASRSTSAG